MPIPLAAPEPRSQEMPEAAKEGTKERRTRIGATVGEVADSAEQITESAVRISRLQPQQAIVLVFIGILTFMCVMFGFQSWRESEDRKLRDRDLRETMQSQMRDYNTQLEMKTIHCAAETEKSRADSRDLVKNILAAFMEEGNKNRAHQTTENDKFRKEITETLKNKTPMGPE